MLTRILRTASSQLSHLFEIDEVPTNASAGVTVAITRLDGTAVDSGSAANPETGVYTYTFPGQASVDLLKVTWTGVFNGATTSVVDYVEVVGAFYVSIDRIRNAPPALDLSRYSAQQLAEARTEAELECEEITGVSFVPRFGRDIVDGTNGCELTLNTIETRQLLKVTIDGTVLTNDERDAIEVSLSGVLYRYGGIWPRGHKNIIVEYEYGQEFATPNIAKAVVMRSRYWVGITDTSVPYRATSITTSAGGTYRLSTPSKAKTGVPDVDAIYAREWIDAGGFA